MATIKSYTSFEQSKKLAEILPLESADMHYSKDFDDSWFVDLVKYTSIKIPKYVDKVEEHLLPCWSLASLLGVARTYCSRLEITIRTDKKYNVFAVKDDFVFRSFDKHPDGFDNLVDACYEMILKLNELKML